MSTDGSLARWQSRSGLLVATLLAGVCLSAVAAHAQNATWNDNAPTNDFNTSTNWTPATVPTGTATFGVSTFHQTPSVTLSANTTIGRFNVAGSNWSFNTGANTL